MRFLGFDSFEGLPKTENKLDAGNVWRAGDFAFSMQKVKKYVKKCGVPSEKIILIKGFYEAVLNEQLALKHGIKKIAYAHIDCDYYSSAKKVLDFIKPYLVEGSIIAFDDYYGYPSPLKGESMALREWLQENNDIKVREFSRYSVYSKSFIVYFQ